MSSAHPVHLVAVVGGSGAGKGWLVDRLCRHLGEHACRLHLDDFYLDRSHLPLRRRARLNFDHPRAIDWEWAERALLACRAGQPTTLPRYDFATHCRVAERACWQPRPFVFVDGLWLLRPPPLRRLFDLKIYLDTPVGLRCTRRRIRDVAERGYPPEMIDRQLRTAVLPMHDRYVEPQKKHADLVLAQPFRETELLALAIVSGRCCARPGSCPRGSTKPSAPSSSNCCAPRPAMSPPAPLPPSMNTATEPKLPPHVLDHFAAFGTPWGRWRHQLYLRWKRLAWRWFVGGAHVTKRALDIFGSGAALLLLSPLFATIALLIKLEDRGPILFRQVRVGRHGREFLMLKFRSMRVDAEARLKELLARNQHSGGVTFKLKDDPRVTRIGKWIRKYSLDELPQFWNVLVGEMSLVGPRPPVPREVALYTLADRRRLAVTPGITCIWQVSGRAEIDFPGQVQLDVRYIESRSLWQDIKILFKTIPAVLTGSGAY